jgi:hypothetical protein
MSARRLAEICMGSGTRTRRRQAFKRLRCTKSTLKGIYNHDGFDHLAPGPDGQTVYTGRAGALDVDGKPVRGGDSRPGSIPELTIPSTDPAYYLNIDDLGGNAAPRTGGATTTAKVTAAVHAAGDGTRLLTVKDLDEMNGANQNESSIQDDLTVDKRFHFVPAGNLLVTIPFSNDRLVLRRLDVRKALDKRRYSSSALRTKTYVRSTCRPV